MKITDIEVALLDSMGTDLTVVNAARVSFDKESTWDHEDHEHGDGYEYRRLVLSEKDAKLIRYLAKHNHWSPFAHTSVQLRVKAPIFVARQLVKHQVGGVWNEVSRRYVDSEPQFWLPEQWRGRPVNAKQGSDGVVEDPVWDETARTLTSQCLDWYNAAIAAGIAPEQARMVLPQNMMTEWYWTGSLVFWARVCKQRLDPHAQEESAMVARQINALIAPLYPVSWKELMA